MNIENEQGQKITLEKIGNTAPDCGASDEWFLCKVVEDAGAPLSVEQIRALILPRVYRDTGAPAGGYFCHWVSVVPCEYSTDVFIVAVKHRHDV